MGHQTKGVSRPVHWRLAAYVRLCVTLTRMFNTSGSATLFFPNFWILNDAIFMVAAGREKTARRHHWHVSLSVRANMHRHVWYFCMCVEQAIACLPGELYNSSRFPRNPIAWALTCLGPRQRLRRSHTALNKRKSKTIWLSDRLRSWQMITEPMK